jgi:hypothetical protein
LFTVALQKYVLLVSGPSGLSHDRSSQPALPARHVQPARHAQPAQSVQPTHPTQPAKSVQPSIPVLLPALPQRQDRKMATTGRETITRGVTCETSSTGLGCEAVSFSTGMSVREAVSRDVSTVSKGSSLVTPVDPALTTTNKDENGGLEDESSEEDMLEREMLEGEQLIAAELIQECGERMLRERQAHARETESDIAEEEVAIEEEEEELVKDEVGLEEVEMRLEEEEEEEECGAEEAIRWIEDNADLLMAATTRPEPEMGSARRPSKPGKKCYLTSLPCHSEAKVKRLGFL